ncbi:MAG TPA: sigma factor-like helix-turn-helix DNA-binding protein [Candidatus Sumerlaeota bacterium]|nr:sigma factor-like helix-turn-helix DNA-binding protein [Candidatus Sumerlaeota bacterium]
MFEKASGFMQKDLTPNTRFAAPEEKLVEAGLLFDTYGELLTERQRVFMRLHFEEDLSFSDIAREFKISRQAVHDSVKHALFSLAELERVLGLVTKAESGHNGGSVPAAASVLNAGVAERLVSLRQQVNERCEPPVSEWICREIGELIALVGERS